MGGLSLMCRAGGRGRHWAAPAASRRRLAWAAGRGGAGSTCDPWQNRVNNILGDPIDLTTFSHNYYGIFLEGGGNA